MSCCGLVHRSHLVIEKSYLENVLYVGNAVGHAEVSHGIPQQDDVGVLLQLLEVLGVPQGAIVFVVHVDQLAFEPPQNALQEKARSDPQMQRAKTKTNRNFLSYIFIKVHEV